MDKKSILFAIGLVAIVGLSVTFIPESPDKDMIVSGVAAVYIIAYFFFFRKKTSEKEKEIKTKIEQLKSEGQALKYEQEVAMTTNDFAILRQKRFTNTLILIFAVLLLGSIALLVIHFVVEYEYKILIELAVAGLLVWLSVYVVRITVKKIDDALKRATKTVVRGIVTDKRIEGDETDNYVLEIENLAIDVKKKIYSKYQVGDGIEIHILKNYYYTVLYEAKIESMNLK
jgi:membrane protein implicated in regulation of membrane protease activity